MTYEYGVALRSDLITGKAFKPHREGMNAREARDWVREWREDCIGDPELFVVIRRPIGEWKTAMLGVFS